MEKNSYYHQRFFNVIYKDMLRRLDKFKQIQQIKNEASRKKAERRFIEEQALVVARFVSMEKHARHQLKNGLKLQQRDIEGWWKRNVEFRKIKRNCLNNFDNLIEFAKKVEIIVAREHFDENEIKILISEIEKEALTIINLSNDYQIKKYGEGILALCRRNKSPVTLAVLFLLASSLAIYTFSNYNIMPINTQSAQVSSTLDDMRASDWAAGAHFSYGFHTMLDRIVQHKSNLRGLQYTSYENQRYGNPDANILEINKGASVLLPSDMAKSLGDNIILEVAALNRGETEIKAIQNGNIVIDVLFHQDKPANIGMNSHNFTNSQLEGMYHSIRLGIEKLANTN